MNKKPQTSMNVALAIILIICLWVGWSEYIFIVVVTYFYVSFITKGN